MVVPPGARLGCALLVLVACGNDGAVLSSGIDASTEPAQACLDGGCTVARQDAATADARVFVPGKKLTGVRIEPPAATLLTREGGRPTQRFQAFAKYDDGSEAAAPVVVYRVDSPAVGDFAGDTFTANGAVGGVATATVELFTPAGSYRASALITVSLERTLRVGTLPDDVAERFANAPLVSDSARAPAVVYPLDGAVVPQNVFPLDVQWSQAAPGDLFRVSWRKPHAQLVGYLAYDTARHWQVELEAWHALARSEPDQPAQLTVERLDGARSERIADQPRTITFARTALTGSIYYWNIEDTRIQRIDDGSGTAVSFMPSPPITNDPSACIGCHSVSNSGRYMAGRLGGADSLGAVFDLTADLTSKPAPTLWPVNEKQLFWWFSSWSPDDSRLIVSAQAGPELRLYDPVLGLRVDTPRPLPLGTMPDWSPDGKKIVYVANPDNFGDRMTRGDIAVLPVTGPDTFGDYSLIQLGGFLPGGSTSSYPSWSPDSARIAFAHGSGSRSESNDSDLYLMKPDGKDVTKLTRALSNVREDFQPNFSPFVGGGYYWLTFLSRRIYGNDTIGNVSKPVSRRQQIWVTAIRTDAAPGEDPSSVPFWLPGQDPKTANISASWAPRACLNDGASCEVGSECCGGDCRPDAAGALVCGPPPPERCHPLYDVCNTSADCCAGSCIDRVCSIAPM
jgi:WD40-like Beta Propeller Repeat